MLFLSTIFLGIASNSAVSPWSSFFDSCSIHHLPFFISLIEQDVNILAREIAKALDRESTIFDLDHLSFEKKMRKKF